MTKALIIYHSKTGNTKQFAEGIAKHLISQGIETQVTSTVLYSNAMLEGVSHIFFGCWTSGLFFFLQKPEKAWMNFVGRIAGKPDAKVALFTTYKLLTGSMFSNMAKALAGKFSPPAITLKSRNVRLSDEHKKILDDFIA
ncbi:MAG TPA: flavodoxin family protein [Anaerolineales bacterium]|nr:flavodoxin family protein [Anaerolineales bacterium]